MGGHVICEQARSIATQYVASKLGGNAYIDLGSRKANLNNAANIMVSNRYDIRFAAPNTDSIGVYMDISAGSV